MGSIYARCDPEYLEDLHTCHQLQGKSYDLIEGILEEQQEKKWEYDTRHELHHQLAIKRNCPHPAHDIHTIC